MMIGGTMYSKGDIVIMQFPFSDMAHAKRRPMLILGEKGKDLIGCAITSNPEVEGVHLDDFEDGTLPLKSIVKYWQIHTVLRELLVTKVARITKRDHREVLRRIHEMFSV